MTYPTIITVYGFPGAGKSTVVDIAEKFNIPSISMGDIVRERAHEELGKDLSSQEIAEWATDERAEHHDAIIATYTAEHLKQLEDVTDLVVVDGVRSQAELDEFNEFNTYTILIKSDFADRLQRLQDRGREDEASFTAGDLANRDAGEIQWGLGELIDDNNHDITIYNDESFDVFRQKAARAVFDTAVETGAFESVELDEPEMVAGVNEINLFLEETGWSFRPTTAVPDNLDEDPFVEFHCPHCTSPVAFNDKVTSLTSPVTCPSCGEEFEIHVSLKPI